MSREAKIAALAALVLALVLVGLLVLEARMFSQETTHSYSAPDILRFRQTSGRVYLDWTGWGYRDVYEVERSTTGDGYFSVIKTVSVTTALDEPLADPNSCDPGFKCMKFYYRVRRFDATSRSEEGVTPEVEIKLDDNPTRKNQ